MQIRPVAFIASMLIALCPVVTPAQAAQTCPPGMSIGACFDKVIDDLEKRVAALEAAKGTGGEAAPGQVAPFREAARHARLSSAPFLPIGTQVSANACYAIDWRAGSSPRPYSSEVTGVA